MRNVGLVSLGALRGDSNSTPPRSAILPESRSAANQITETFPYQSYFDSTLLWKALLEQPLGQPIIQSTLRQQQASGYAIGNHPDSQAPVAVVFSGEGRQSGSAVHIIPPGGIVRPTSGLVSGDNGFQSFSWGLPFGWLGGGTVTIAVFQTPESWADWTPNNEMIFHRFRAQILAPGSIPAAGSITSWPRNWPLRFPALNVQRGSSSIPQGGAPQITISQPGTIEFNLHTTISSPSKITALLYRTTDFSDEQVATPSPIPLEAIEFTVPGQTTLATPAGYTLRTPFLGPYALARLGCNAKATSVATMLGGVHFVSDDAQLQGQYMDVVRYGYL